MHTTPVKPCVDDTKVSRTPEFQLEIDNILAEDTENKRWERIYLNEILVARDNDDNAAYKFFVLEFVKLPRLRLPEWMKDEPNYTPGLNSQEVLDANIRVVIRPSSN